MTNRLKSLVIGTGLAATMLIPATDAEAGWFSRRRANTYRPAPAKQTYEPTQSRDYNSTQSRTPRKLTVAEEYQAQRVTPQEAAKAPEQPTPYTKRKKEVFDPDRTVETIAEPLFSILSEIFKQ